MEIPAEDINSGKYVFNDVFHVFKYLKDIGWNIGWYAPPQFEVMQLDSPNHVVASPKPFTPLFRGQNSFYEKCYPSLFRKEWDITEELERLVQLEDFKTILTDNQEIENLVSAGLEVNYEALAQHYGIETSIIDLTNSFGVAAFFATTDYDSVTDTYNPITESYRQGVIYFLPMGMFTNLQQGFGDQDYKIYPIGMEALPRPGDQRGFGAYMKKGVDFNSVSPIKFFFRQNKVSSMHCSSLFNFGRHLFPYDPMVEKVRNIRKYRIYGQDSIIAVVENHPELNMNLENAIKSLSDKGCIIMASTPFRYTRQELDFITKRYHQKYPNDNL